MPQVKIRKISICGFGLIGGSMALDLQRGRRSIQICAYDRHTVLKKLARDNRFKVKYVSKFDSALANADIVILAAPHRANELMLTRMTKSTRNCLILDTGAVKTPIANLASKLEFGEKTQFLPTHPMAGKEKAGFANAAPNLFKNHSWFIDENVRLNSTNKAKLNWMIELLGAKPTYIENKLHDELMSEISHLPQLISTILGAQVNPNLIPLSGPGLRSMLRLAGSPYSVWSEIINENRSEIVKALHLFKQNLIKVTHLVASHQSLDKVFKDALRSYQCL
jgi:prephenate dehydrogenase